MKVAVSDQGCVDLDAVCEQLRTDGINPFTPETPLSDCIGATQAPAEVDTEALEKYAAFIRQLGFRAAELAFQFENLPPEEQLQKLFPNQERNERKICIFGTRFPDACVVTLGSYVREAADLLDHKLVDAVRDIRYALSVQTIIDVAFRARGNFAKLSEALSGD